MFCRRVITQIDIEAPPGEVWRHLADFDAYAEWNPFISGIKGEARKGSPLELTIRQHGGKELVVRATIKAVEPGKKLVWRGRTMIRGFLDNEHTFTIEDLGNGTSRLVQSEVFTGFLAPYLPRSLGEQTTVGFEMLNKVLKERVESAAAQGEEGR